MGHNRAVTPERRAAYILAAIALVEGVWVVLNAWGNARGLAAFLGFLPGRTGTPMGWLAAAVVVVVFVSLATRLPSVRSTMFRASWLKLLGILVAVAAGILEEAVFRKLLMDWLSRGGQSVAVQIVASGVAFGAAHGVWGLFARSARAAAGATVATGALGVALATVYILAGRSLAPCVVAHFAINALLEPGLVLAAMRGEMGRRRPVLHVPATPG